MVVGLIFFLFDFFVWVFFCVLLVFFGLVLGFFGRALGQVTFVGVFLIGLGVIWGFYCSFEVIWENRLRRRNEESCVGAKILILCLYGCM